jgi:hypothetical protein
MSLNAAPKHHYSPETKEENIHELGSHSGDAHGQITATENVSDVHLNVAVHIKSHTLTSCGAHLGVRVLLKNAGGKIQLTCSNLFSHRHLAQIVHKTLLRAALLSEVAI